MNCQIFALIVVHFPQQLLPDINNFPPDFPPYTYHLIHFAPKGTRCCCIPLLILGLRQEVMYFHLFCLLQQQLLFTNIAKILYAFGMEQRLDSAVRIEEIIGNSNIYTLCKRKFATEMWRIHPYLFVIFFYICN